MEDTLNPGTENIKMLLLYGRNLDLARTAAHYFMFMILGLVMAIPGPTILDLQQSSASDEYGISFIFVARSIGYVMGSIIGGIILDYIKNEQAALIISSLFVSAGTFTIPWCENLTMLLTTFYLTGFAVGFSNTGSNASCLRIWGKKGAPYLQGLHFFYGLGGFFAPLLAAPFLSAQVPLPSDSISGVLISNDNITSFDAIKNVSYLHLHITSNKTIIIPSIAIAYAVIGTLGIFASMSFLLVLVLSTDQKHTAGDKDCANTTNPGLLYTVTVVVIACLQTGLISGVEVSFASMLTSYVVKSIHNLSKVTGTLMTSMYWGSFTLTRLLSIPLALKINVKHLLLFDLILSVTASILLLTVGTWSQSFLWVGTALLGIGVASIFPATLSLIEKYININNRIASVFTIFSSALEMSVPLSINMHLSSYPNVLFQFITAATISCSVLFILLNILLAYKGEKYVDKGLRKEKVIEQQVATF